MDIYTALTIATISLSVLLVVFTAMFFIWFKIEKKVAKYGKSVLYNTKKK